MVALAPAQRQQKVGSASLMLKQSTADTPKQKALKDRVSL
jgi:hypothetical protein